MDQLIANLDTINNCSLELDEKSRYFASKKSTFSAYSFGSCVTLSNFLRELQTSYINTSLKFYIKVRPRIPRNRDLEDRP